MKQSKVELIKDYIYSEIEAGRIKNGQRLPSCREVASVLSVNKITVNKAYHELENEHKAYSIPRGGFYLLGFETGMSTGRDIIDFKTVGPDKKLVPYREFGHAMNKAIDLYKADLFGYESAGGLDMLRKTLKEEFAKDGVYTPADRIIITHGAQQAIHLVFQAIFRNNTGKLLVEAPTYNLALKLAEYHKIEVTGIERTPEGFDYKELERLLQSGGIRAFYIIPRHHNPTGYSLPEKSKQRIAGLCSKYNVIVIEDDYLADLGSGKGSLPIHYYDVNKHTVYIRSFSKTFMPGIRMGAAVLPEDLLDEVLSLKGMSDLSTSGILQAALDIFIKSGMYDKHIRKVRRLYEAKLNRAAEIFKAFGPEKLYRNVPEHGIFIWIRLPEHIEPEKLEKELEREGILVKSASDFFPDYWSKGKTADHNNYIRLCISGVKSEHLEALGTVLSLMGTP